MTAGIRARIFVDDPYGTGVGPHIDILFDGPPGELRVRLDVREERTASVYLTAAQARNIGEVIAAAGDDVALALAIDDAQNWASYECKCENAVFDVRTDAARGPRDVVNCPLCGAVCKLSAWWPADDAGYGSRGDT